MATKTTTKTTTTTPLFAVVGVTDLAVERAREARLRADKVRSELAPAAVQNRAQVVLGEAKAFPTKALNTGVATVDQVAKGYEDLADRGEKLVTRIRNQKATKDLVAQAETTLALGKGAVTTARKAVLDIRTSALATITTGRHEAAHVAEIVVDTVAEDAAFAATDIKASAKRTRTAAKRTNTTATKAAKRTTSSAKATTTSARKTAATTTKATAKAAEKVGD
ncbi:hypothetical protein [Knoellia aerolata]|uniref:Uncharacterized protein n=1 Tax=Knoellia aerolata DSM 18566 TaxID=1385519 RepID=A0A0A0JV25_9MICO|nr:hypothetical protein [Knoellia aerolata]KGN40539.1 hypothetical protein N801_19290 [Knoellia aerolata DSM 18566]